MKIVAFGEVMIRMMPEDYKLLNQVDKLEFQFSGTCSNILSGLYQFNNKVSLLTCFPRSSIGYCAAASMRKLGIEDNMIEYSGAHMGMYFLEQGFGHRPTNVTYMDRSLSSFNRWSLDMKKFDKEMSDVDFIHICGISLATSANSFDNLINLISYAKDKGIQIIFDFNYRETLWENVDKDKIKKLYEQVLEKVDIVFATERDCLEILGFTLPAKYNQSSLSQKRSYLLKTLASKYNINYIFGTNRVKLNDEKHLIGFLVHNNHIFYSKPYKVDVLDRIGAGDGFAVGAIQSVIFDFSDIEKIEFAVSCGILTHTTYGDSCVVNPQMIEMYRQNIEIIR